MVFCGRPSKACHRCRGRRLRCDLRKSSCGQCDRAKVVCTGYRDTQQLRIRNESQAVRRKALSRAKEASPVLPRPVALSLEWQARDVFFAWHVTGTSKTWDFLSPFYDQTNAPEHLKLSIDAVSLAYLAHQVYSDRALMTARERYVAALRMTNKALQSLEIAGKDTTLLTALLLDLFEKITCDEHPRKDSWAGHVYGALALVRLRGLENFQNPSILRVLARLGTNLLISCVVSETSVPRELIALRDHVGTYLNVRDPKCRLSDLMVFYANLQSDIRRGHLSISDCISQCIELDAKLQALAFDMPPSWMYRSTIVESKSQKIYDQYLDTYPDRHTTQTWNVLRLVRVLLNEKILEYLLVSAANPIVDTRSHFIKFANDNIKSLSREICASVPQYLICGTDAQGCRSTLENCTWPGEVDSVTDQNGHIHSPSQNLDCYTLIFPLYVVGQSRNSPKALKQWVTQQLHYLGSHFGIRNASFSARTLQQGADIPPWTIYAMLGSYAFVT